jgi:hypothetical protein
MSCNKGQVAASGTISPGTPAAMAAQPRCSKCGQFAGDGHVCPTVGDGGAEDTPPPADQSSTGSQDMQTVFDAAYKKSMAAAGYEHIALSRGLEAVLEAAGYGAVAADVPGVCYNCRETPCGHTEVREVVRWLCASLAGDVPSLPLGGETIVLAKGGEPQEFHQRATPRIPTYTMATWADQIAYALRNARPPIERGNGRYREFLRKEALGWCAQAMRAEANRIIAERQEAVARVLHEQELILQEAQDAAAYWQRTGRVVAALLAATGVPDEWQLVTTIGKRRRAIENGITLRRRQIGEAARFCERLNPDEVVTASVKGHEDLEALWKIVLETRTDLPAPQEAQAAFDAAYARTMAEIGDKYTALVRGLAAVLEGAGCGDITADMLAAMHRGHLKEIRGTVVQEVAREFCARLSESVLLFSLSHYPDEGVVLAAPTQYRPSAPSCH